MPTAPEPVQSQGIPPHAQPTVNHPFLSPCQGWAPTPLAPAEALPVSFGSVQTGNESLRACAFRLDTVRWQHNVHRQLVLLVRYAIGKCVLCGGCFAWSLGFLFCGAAALLYARVKGGVPSWQLSQLGPQPAWGTGQGQGPYPATPPDAAPTWPDRSAVHTWPACGGPGCVRPIPAWCIPLPNRRKS